MCDTACLAEACLGECPICFDDVTNDVISPLEAQAIDISNFRIWMPNNTMTLRTVLMG